MFFLKDEPLLLISILLVPYLYFQGPSVGAANIPSMPQTGLPYYNPEAKGQLILKGRFGVFKSTKKPTKFLSGFLP